MNSQNTKTFRDEFGGHSAQYRRARPTYPPELFEWVLAQSEKESSQIEVWDVGSGTGQTAVHIAPFVKSVHASDPSENQIKNAVEHPKVSYLVAPCQHSSLPSSSVDLITASTAYHWFDHAAFFKEVERVLRPGGVVAIWAYTGMHFPKKDKAIETLFNLWNSENLGGFWDPCTRDRYQGVYDAPMPYPTIDAPPFSIKLEWTREQYLDCIRSWSAYNAYLRKHNKDPLELVQSELGPLWNSEERKSIEAELIVRVIKKAL